MRIADGTEGGWSPLARLTGQVLRAALRLMRSWAGNTRLLSGHRREYFAGEGR